MWLLLTGGVATGKGYGYCSQDVWPLGKGCSYCSQGVWPLGKGFTGGVATGKGVWLLLTGGVATGKGVWLLLTGGVATGKALPPFLDHVRVTYTLEVRGHLAVRETAIEEVRSWPNRNHIIKWVWSV